MALISVLPISTADFKKKKMASNDIINVIQHYKRNIEKISNPPERALKYEERLLHCIGQLYKLPVNVNHLQDTGVGRTVNSLRKIDGEVGDAAKALVLKWKNMVMLEDEAERKNNEEVSPGPSDEDLQRIKLIREAEKAELKKTENNKSNDKSHKQDSLDDRNKKRKHESNHEESSHSKSRKSEELNGNSSSKSSKHGDKKSSHKEHKSSSNFKSSSSSSSSSKHKSSSSDKSESKKHKSKSEDNGIDSQSGASFAAALGPVMVKKSKKKSNHSSTISSPDNSSDNGASPVKVKIKEESKSNGALFPSAALTPLEPDLVEPLALPVTTPHYKPNPVNYYPIPEPQKKKILTEEDALATIMSSKNQRTKVYSGVKGGLTRVPSLYEFCCRVLQQHLDALEYTGGIPFSLLEPVLVTASPSQLYQFEHYNPYVIEDTDELWKRHVNKEFRTEKRQEFESWRDMYLRCVDEREQKFKAVSANIAKSIEKSVPVRKTKLAYIDVAKPPRNILKKQIKNGITKPDTSRLIGKNDPDAVRVPLPKHQPTTREPSVFKMKPKVAPLMQKTLKSIKMTRFKR